MFTQSRVLAVLLAAALGAGSALAEKPDWAGGGKNRGDDTRGQMKHQRDDRGQRANRGGDRDQRWTSDDDRRDRGADRRKARGASSAPAITIAPGSFFNDGQRRHAQQWYGEQSRAGRCPPGLAKKNNGCMPPGQAKKWRMGQALPSDVVYYPVPQPVLQQLGLPPAGYEYVRVANDILLMATGTRMVVDAISDLGRMF
ncbi:MAG: hypothetical protein Q4G70_08355 [Pseudomonadota bacterium]|nr:hypothetical protein [Pseudomonadota bacterium]